MKRLSYLLFILLVCLATQAQSLSRIENSPYPVSEKKTDKLYLTSEKFSYSQKIILQSLQGMLARTKPEILRDVHGHAEILGNYVTIDRTYYNHLNGLLALYVSRFDGYILCEAKTSSVNVAFSLCPVLNAIAVPADIEQDAINAGYKKVLDVRGKDEAWALANYADQLSKTIASYQAVNDDRALFLGDYSVFAGALQFWDSSAKGTLAKSVYARMNPSAVYFGWGAGEYDTVEQLSQYSAMIHPSDWSPNLSTLSNIPAKLPRQKSQQAEYKVVPNVHTVCFVITDGDNIQWLSGSLNNTGNWANSDNARLKLGWTVSPAFAELAPTLYRKYIENAVNTENARNYLVAGPSGTGYYFPSIYPQLSEQSKTMNQMLKKADLNIVNIIDKDGNHNPNEYLKQSNVDALFYYSYGGQYTKLAGEIKWYKDKPSIGGRFTLWGSSEDNSKEVRERVAQSLADKLNTQSTNIYSSNGYSLIPVHIWSMNPSDVLNCMEKLNPNVRVVSPDEFVWLIRKNVRQLKVANGNGLRAEYTLTSDSETPILTTNESTIDFDEEYLTESGELVAEKDFIAVWTGQIQPLYSEKYTFHSTAEGGIVLKIDDNILCDSINNLSVSSSDTITLQSGKRYNLEFRYKKNIGKARAVLEWESPSQVKQRIPRYQLFSRPQPSVGSVTAFDAVDYQGYSGALKLGNYNSELMGNKGFGLGEIKSFQVAKGFKVVLFSEDNFKGDSITILTNNNDLADWAGRTASLKVLPNGANIPEGIYFIKPVDGNSIMGIDGGIKSMENGKQVKLFRNTGAINQQFRFERLNDGSYRIESVSSKKSLEIDNFSKENGALLQQWKTDDVENQKFIIVPTDIEGAYKIVSGYSGKIIEASSTSSNAQIYQSEDNNQPTTYWQFEAVPALSNGTGNGLTADYYNGLEFSTWYAARIDTAINFNWGTGSPMRGVNANNFSVRWQGKIEPRADSEYTFYINSDNGRRLWINDRLVIDGWVDDYDIEYSGNIALQGGQQYDMKLEYFETTGGAYCRLEWLSAKQPREVVPRTQLYSLDYTGTEELNVNNCFSVYPNPARNEVRIVDHNINEGDALWLIGMSGQVIKTQQLNKLENRIDISDVPAGIYFISLTGENKSSVKKLIVK